MLEQASGPDPMLDALIDSDAYPIEQLQTPIGAALVARVREQLETDGAVVLRGFARPEAVARMTREAGTLLPLAWPGPQAATAHVYDYAQDAGLAVDDAHPLRRTTPRRMAQIAADLIPSSHRLVHLYRATPMRAFLAAVLRSRCSAIVIVIRHSTFR